MNREKLSIMRAVQKAKCLMLVTDRESFLYGRINGLDNILMIHALKEMLQHTEKLIKKWEEDLGRNQSRRSKSGRSSKREAR